MSIEALINHIGYPLVFLIVAAEYSGLPLPGETAVLLAAAAAGAGKGFHFGLVFLFAAIGAIAGNTIGYQIGRRGGRVFIERLSGLLRFKEAHIRKTEDFFARYGVIAIFIGRWISYLRVLTALMAGVSRMHYPKFLLCNVLSGILWAGVVTFLGFKFGRNIAVVEQGIEEIGLVTIVVALTLVAVYFLATRLFFHHDNPRK
jgi:membrane protein DedA with SNARE-associated domain